MVLDSIELVVRRKGEKSPAAGWSAADIDNLELVCMHTDICFVAPSDGVQQNCAFFTCFFFFAFKSG